MTIIENNKLKKVDEIFPTKHNSNWKVFEFLTPITEAVNAGKSMIIRGVAINETITRNGIKYIAEELEKSASSFKNKPILLDHKNEIGSIVGRTTENVVYNPTKKAIEFEAKIMDDKIKEMINDGRITDVSIGAQVLDLVENKEEKSVTAIGIEGMELSLVAVPGDPGANIGQALENSFHIKEKLDLMEEVKGGIKDNMVEEGQIEETHKETNEKVIQEIKDLSSIEEKLKEFEAKIAKYEAIEAKRDMEVKINKEVDLRVEAKMKELKENTPPEQLEKEKPIVEDETKGVVADESDETEEIEESFVVEKADMGKGFQIYRDTNTLPDKFKRLRR